MRRRLAQTADLPDLDDVTVARLAVFAALHDIGKVNKRFQTQIWRDEELDGWQKPSRAGHTSNLVPVLLGDDQETSEWLLEALGWDQYFSTWDADGGHTASALFIAALSHHGRPLNLHDPLPKNPQIWRAFRSHSPRRFVERIGRLARDWFPIAFSPNALSLPSDPRFQHMFLGLCNLADWIGSDEDLFCFVDEPDDDYMQTAREQATEAIKALALNIEAQRECLPDLPAFGELFDIEGSPQPNAIQEQSAWKTPLEEHLVIIESETGSGKTEAALWRFARMYEAGLVDGLYFALPTRAAAKQLHARVTAFAANLFPADRRPESVLAVPGYVRAGDFTGQHLPGFQVLWDDNPDLGTGKRRWAAESNKRFLAAQIAVGTVDQAMMAALQVRHAHLRASCLARSLLVVDEVHASDPYMRVVLEALLNAHLGAGGYALLMSATLGSAARRQWLLRPKRATDLPSQSLHEAIETAYPAISTCSDRIERVVGAGENDQNKVVSVDANPSMHDFDHVAGLALGAARLGAKVLLIRNTVDYAVETQRAIETSAKAGEEHLMFRCNGRPTLHTGRFAAEDRLLLDAEVERQLGKRREGGGRVVVGTQTLEQSLDIDADLLITDLCPMDVLLQRIGRLHRHVREERPSGYGEPRCIVLLPPHDDLSPFLSKRAGGLARNGLGGYVYPDLRVLELTRRFVVDVSNTGEAWHIPEMNRELVERTTHPDTLGELVEDLGGDWTGHRNEVEGVGIADQLTARNVVIRRDVSFLDCDVVFADAEEEIRTRLGGEGIEVRFNPRPASPFDVERRISKLVIPEHMSRGIASDDEIEPIETEDGFDFAVGTRRFGYDRMGLHQRS